MNTKNPDHDVRYPDFLDGPFVKYSFAQFIKENQYLADGVAFLVVSVVPEKDETSEGDAVMRLDVVSSPMDADLLRGMLLAATYHSNMHGTGVDTVLVRREQNE